MQHLESLSYGEFTDMEAANPHDVIEHSTFHAKILNNHMDLKRESDSFCLFASAKYRSEKNSELQ